jgi:hypothetical protein
MPMSNFGDMVPWFDIPLIGIRQDFGFGATGKTAVWTAAPKVAGICLHLFQSNQGLTRRIMSCALTAGE